MTANVIRGSVDSMKMQQDRAELVNNKYSFLEFNCLDHEKRTNTAAKQAGPLSLDQTSGWKQPESDND